MKSEPLQSSVEAIVCDLQKYGYAVVENLYEDLCVEKLGYEVKDVIRNSIANNSMFLFRLSFEIYLLIELEDNRKTIVAEPSIFIEALIDSISNTFLRELNIAYTNYHSENKLNIEQKYLRKILSITSCFYFSSLLELHIGTHM